MSLPAHSEHDTPDLCVILTTTATEDEARELACGLGGSGVSGLAARCYGRGCVLDACAMMKSMEERA